MTAKDIQQSLWNSRKGIALLVAAALLLCFVYIGLQQSYTAEVYIKYLDESAEKGTAPDRSVLNPYEIADPYVVSKALAQLGVNDLKASSICQKITVTPVISIAEEEKYASWVNSFSSYEESEKEKPHAVYYCIKFTTGDGAVFAENFLGALVKQYRIYFTEKYAGESTLVLLEKEQVLTSDYFEAVQHMQKKIEDNIDCLERLVNDDWNYRSAVTGYSLEDLIDEYALLLQTKIAPVGKYVLEQGISKDAETLIASLITQVDHAQMESEKTAQQAESQIQLMEVYADKAYDYLWEVSGESGTSQVRDLAVNDDYYNNIMTTYDQMMQQYVDYATQSRDWLIDKAYNEQYLGNFSSVSTTSKALDALLPEIYQEYEDLHVLSRQTLEGYNEYRASKYVFQVSGVTTQEALPELLYYAVTLICALGISAGGVLFFELIRKKEI